MTTIWIDAHLSPAIATWITNSFEVAAAGENLVGGLVGATYCQWLYVDVFWIHESYRGGGTGTSLLAAAEQEAARRGCQYAYLDTFSFQAPEFYKKLGYVVFGELPDFPAEHSRIFLKKVLQ